MSANAEKNAPAPATASERCACGRSKRHGVISADSIECADCGEPCWYYKHYPCEDQHVFREERYDVPPPQPPPPTSTASERCAERVSIAGIENFKKLYGDWPACGSEVIGALVAVAKAAMAWNEAREAYRVNRWRAEEALSAACARLRA